MKRTILLATTAVLCLSSTIQAQDVVVMRRTIAPPNMKAPTPNPTTGATPTPGSTASPTPTSGSTGGSTPTPGSSGGGTSTPTPTPGATGPGGGTPTPTPGSTPSPTPTTTPSPTPTPVDNDVHWSTTPWVTDPACGQSVQRSVATCLDSKNQKVEDQRCISAIGPKPPESNPAMSYATCTYSWATGNWGAWSSTCNATASHSRTVQCQRDLDKEVMPTDKAAEYCTVRPIPPSTETARVTTDCKYQWVKTFSYQVTDVKGSTPNGPWYMKSYYSYPCTDTTTQKAVADSYCDARILGAKPNGGYTANIAVTPTLVTSEWRERGYSDWFPLNTNVKQVTNSGDVIARQTFTFTGPLQTWTQMGERARLYCLTKIEGYYNASPNSPSTSYTNMTWPYSCQVSEQFRVKATNELTYEVVVVATNAFVAGYDMLQKSSGTNATLTRIPTSSGAQNLPYSREIAYYNWGLTKIFYMHSTPEESGCKLTDTATTRFLCKP